jgi:tRNA(His) 5'-end guanylyltransferase
MRRCPVAIRIDGKAFHTFTRGFDKPFDEVLVKSMQNTMKYLCENIQGCVFGYTQSDEITLILLDYQTLDTDAWFDYEVQKMCSIAASIATMAFNKYFYAEKLNWYETALPTTLPDEQKIIAQLRVYQTAAEKGAMFDARVFNIPKEEVTNLVYWRQLDAARNSVQMVGQANFPHKELQGKSCNDIQDMLMTQKGINWNDFPTYLKRGSACIKKEKVVNVECAPSNGVLATVTTRPGWEIDLDMPMLKGDGRKYLDDLIFIGE